METKRELIRYNMTLLWFTRDILLTDRCIGSKFRQIADWHIDKQDIGRYVRIIWTDLRWWIFGMNRLRWYVSFFVPYFSSTNIVLRLYENWVTELQYPFILFNKHDQWNVFCPLTNMTTRTAHFILSTWIIPDNDYHSSLRLCVHRSN